MAQKKERYCYLTHDFPEKALIVAVFFTLNTEPNLLIIPLSTVSKDIHGVIESIKQFVRSLKISKDKKAKQIQEVIDKAILIPITFVKLYPLKKEYWTKSKIDKDLKDRISAFLPALNYVHAYKLLVVPYRKIKKNWEFAAAYPFSIFDDDTEIEKFIYGSDQQIDITAKYAAIYSFGVPKRLNWKTGEVSFVKRESLQKDKIVN
jgi:hypothetical protein